MIMKPQDIMGLFGMAKENTPAVGTGTTNVSAKPIHADNVLAAAREADKFLPGLDLWALIDPQGRVYRGTAEELFPVLAAAHPLLKTRIL